MLILPILFRRRRRRAITIQHGPVLISAIADFNETSITLTFDRAIEMVSYDASAIVAYSATNQMKYVGNGSFDPPAGNVVKLFMGEIDEYHGDQNLLDATATTGIRAADDHVAWNGVSGFVVNEG